MGLRLDGANLSIGKLQGVVETLSGGVHIEAHPVPAFFQTYRLLHGRSGSEHLGIVVTAEGHGVGGECHRSARLSLEWCVGDVAAGIPCLKHDALAQLVLTAIDGHVDEVAVALAVVLYMADPHTDIFHEGGHEVGFILAEGPVHCQAYGHRNAIFLVALIYSPSRRITRYLQVDGAAFRHVVAYIRQTDALRVFTHWHVGTDGKRYGDSTLRFDGAGRRRS